MTYSMGLGHKQRMTKPLWHVLVYLIYVVLLEFVATPPVLLCFIYWIRVDGMSCKETCHHDHPLTGSQCAQQLFIHITFHHSTAFANMNYQRHQKPSKTLKNPQQSHSKSSTFQNRINTMENQRNPPKTINNDLVLVMPLLVTSMARAAFLG